MTIVAAVVALVVSACGGTKAATVGGSTTTAASGGPASAAAPSVTTLAHGELKVCLYAGFAPFSFKNAQGWQGWDVDFLRGMAQQLGLRFVPVEEPGFNGIWDRPGKGQCDVAASGITQTSARRDETGPSASWSAPYYHVARAYAVRTGQQLNGVGDLAGKTVIVTKGSSADIDLVNQLKLAGINNTKIEYTENEATAARLVAGGRSGTGPFAYGGGEGSIQDLVSQIPGLQLAWVHCLMLGNGQQTSEPFSFVVRSASTGLIDAVNQYIAHPSAPYPGGPGTGLDCPPAP